MIEESYLIEMIQALKRIRTNQLNDSDKRTRIRSQKILQKYKAIWQEDLKTKKDSSL